MKIQFLGAAQTVTGSKHLVTASSGARVLLDCGLFQGHRRESNQRNRAVHAYAESLDAVVLSHAHLDHSGALPILVKEGFRGPIYATPATRDLAAAMLMDAVVVQEADARYINHRIAREGVDMDPVTPLFTDEDVAQALSQITSLPYHHPQSIALGVRLAFFDAGHVLGSAISALDFDEPGGSKRLVFTGDLGRKEIPILRDPELVPGAHALIMESTYGDRNHPAFRDMGEALAAVVRGVHERGGKILIPSFALERAQEILLVLKGLRKEKRIPAMPVYVDSPLAIGITDVFKLHPECFDRETRALVREPGGLFDFPELRYTASTEESMAIDASHEPCIVIAGSGMCEGGRILHHLRGSIESEKNCVLIVGYQAPYTLGRRIAEHRPRVKIFGVDRDLRAEVVVLEGFSAHAGQNELLDYAREIRSRGDLRDIILVHGDPPAQKALRQRLERDPSAAVHVPADGETLSL